MQENPYDEPTLLGALTGYWALILCLALLGILAGWGYSARQPPLYEARSAVLLRDPVTQGVFAENRITGDPGRYVRNQAVRFESTEVAGRAAEIVGEGLTAGHVSGATTALQSLDSDQVTISAVAPESDLAVQMANAVAQAYEEVTAEDGDRRAEAAITELRQAQQNVERQIQDLEQRVASAPDDGVLLARRDAALNRLVTLQARADQVLVDARLQNAGLLVMEPAAETALIQPMTQRNVGMGGLFGVIGGMGLAWFLSNRRRTVREPQAAAAILQAPLLGAVPQFRSQAAHQASLDSRAPAAEAYHVVAGALSATLGGLDGKSILIASAGRGEGKTVTALNLALAMTSDESPVLLVDGDVRARGLTMLTGMIDRPGLGDYPHRDSYPRIYCLQDGLEAGHTDHDQCGVALLPAGSPVEEAPSYLRSGTFRLLMRTLRAQARLVMVDSPPLLMGADATAIAGHVDGIVLVVDPGTPLAALAEVRERLQFVPSPLLGYVYNRSDPRREAPPYRPAIPRSVAGAIRMPWRNGQAVRDEGRVGT